MSLLDSSRPGRIFRPWEDRIIYQQLSVGPGNISGGSLVRSSSARAHKKDQVDILYIHSPDRATPIEQILQAFDNLYKAGKFLRLGVSNLSAEEVDRLCEVR